MVNAVAVLQRRATSCRRAPGTPSTCSTPTSTASADGRRPAGDLPRRSATRRRTSSDSTSPTWPPAAAEQPADGLDGGVSTLRRAPVVLADRRRLDRSVANLLRQRRSHGGGAVRCGRAARRRRRARHRGRRRRPRRRPPTARDRIFERFAAAARRRPRGTDRVAGSASPWSASTCDATTAPSWVDRTPGRRRPVRRRTTGGAGVKRPDRLLLVALACLLAAACGVSSEDQPQPITETVSSDSGPTPSVDSSPDSASPSSITAPTTTTTTSPTQPSTRRVPPPHSTEPSLTR